MNLERGLRGILGRTMRSMIMVQRLFKRLILLDAALGNSYQVELVEINEE